MQRGAMESEEGAGSAVERIIAYMCAAGRQPADLLEFEKTQATPPSQAMQVQLITPQTVAAQPATTAAQKQPQVDAGAHSGWLAPIPAALRERLTGCCCSEDEEDEEHDVDETGYCIKCRKFTPVAFDQDPAEVRCPGCGRWGDARSQHCTEESEDGLCGASYSGMLPPLQVCNRFITAMVRLASVARPAGSGGFTVAHSEALAALSRLDSLDLRSFLKRHKRSAPIKSARRSRAPRCFLSVTLASVMETATIVLQVYAAHPTDAVETIARRVCGDEGFRFGFHDGVFMHTKERNHAKDLRSSFPRKKNVSAKARSKKARSMVKWVAAIANDLTGDAALNANARRRAVAERWSRISPHIVALFMQCRLIEGPTLPESKLSRVAGTPAEITALSDKAFLIRLAEAGVLVDVTGAGADDHDQPTPLDNFSEAPDPLARDNRRRRRRGRVDDDDDDENDDTDASE